MKLKFDANLDYQQTAIGAVVDIFAGQMIAPSHYMIENTNTNAQGELMATTGFDNNITLTDEQILENLQKTQENNDIEKSTQLNSKDFSIEMETGTGKTYVYLRTIFELSFYYNLRKFVIVVPSIAVREGVLKSIEMMHQHFKTLYKNKEFNYFVYDSKKLNAVRQFATSNHIEIMIINIQSFQREIDNIIHQEYDRMDGRKPIEFIQGAKPIVIIDEPQSVDNTDKAKQAIARLNPAVTLRYSATHRDRHHLVYQLNPIQAYDLGLVKKIEVASVIADNAVNDAYVKLIKTDNINTIRAQVEIHYEKNGEVQAKKLWVKDGDDLFSKSGRRGLYRQGYVITGIDCREEFIIFGNGKKLHVGEALGGFNDEIMKAQIRTTIEQHLIKQKQLKRKKIKVLSLFFIDRVANYRIHHEGGGASLGKIGKWFEEIYAELTQQRAYKEFVTNNIAKLHNGYFAKDNRGVLKDSKGDTKDDIGAYQLIMRDKERLLSVDEDLQFIFSHSALREGWDNPNVFQICTLNQTRSVDKKRQEIGRGLRLSVNNKGDRIHDENINRLTVIANESYEEFAEKLQKEFEDDCNIKFGRVKEIDFAKIIRIDERQEKNIGQDESKKIFQKLYQKGYIDSNGDILNKFNPDDKHFELNIGDEYQDIALEITDKMKSLIFKNRVKKSESRKEVKFKKQVYLSEDFQQLWERIKPYTRYRVAYDSDKLITKAAKRIKDTDNITPAKIHEQRANLNIRDAGVQAEGQGSKSYSMDKPRYVPDLLAYLQEKTELTRHTLLQILQNSGRLQDFHTNPQIFMAMVAREILNALHELMINGIRYEKLEGKYWEMQQIEEEASGEITRYINNLYAVQNENKTLYDYIEYTGSVEKQFAEDLDNNEAVKFFMKLPAWFKIDTPIGFYNPDWAFVAEKDGKLYFVRETKSSKDSSKLRVTENHKILCGKKHFKALGVDYAVVTKLSEVSF